MAPIRTSTVNYPTEILVRVANPFAPGPTRLHSPKSPHAHSFPALARNPHGKTRDRYHQRTHISVVLALSFASQIQNDKSRFQRRRLSACSISSTSNHIPGTEQTSERSVKRRAVPSPTNVKANQPPTKLSILDDATALNHCLTAHSTPPHTRNAAPSCLRRPSVAPHLSHSSFPKVSRYDITRELPSIATLDCIFLQPKSICACRRNMVYPTFRDNSSPRNPVPFARDNALLPASSKCPCPPVCFCKYRPYQHNPGCWARHRTS